MTPPWASPRFDTLCTRCDACVAACPTRLLVRGDGGFPTTDYTRGECSFCGDCAAACDKGALQRDDGVPAWRRSAVIGDDCLTRARVVCRSCGEQCDAGAIGFAPTAGGVAQPAIDPARCTGCGACVAPCPNGAITINEDKPKDIRRVA